MSEYLDSIFEEALLKKNRGILETTIIIYRQEAERLEPNQITEMFDLADRIEIMEGLTRELTIPTES